MMWHNGWTQGSCGMFGGGYGWGGWLLTIALVVGIALLIGALVRTVSNREKPAARVAQAGLELLNERYVKGEITREEYLQIRDDLN
ncbi:MAG: SHOCT domain-containing protein [Anaerolineaceae bacterium]|nr:SHOCT domain-containing protein [Anaerolineaceae bacterium]